MAIGFASAVAGHYRMVPSWSSEPGEAAGGIAGWPCPNPGVPCCEFSSFPGCEDEACCTMICAFDPFCCETRWDPICAFNANQYCTVCGGAAPVCGDGVCETPLESFEGCPADCPGPCDEDINGDKTVNVDDLLSVIAGWGEGPTHPADVNDDGIVNVDDLLAVINAWGPCG
jgi:hypothetical protein